MDIEAAKNEVLSQTARIEWIELERHFAAGNLIFISDALDLIEVGVNLIKDNKNQFQEWTSQQLVYPLTDTQAAKWYDQKTILWAAVVAPWVLVQERADKGAV